MWTHRASVSVKRCATGFEKRNDFRRWTRLFHQGALTYDLFRGHFLPPFLLRRHRVHNPPRSRDIGRTKGKWVHRIWCSGSFGLLPSLESTEATLLLRVGDVDRVHRQTREAVSPANRAAKRARVASVHVAVSDALSETF